MIPLTQSVVRLVIIVLCSTVHRGDVTWLRYFLFQQQSVKVWALRRKNCWSFGRGIWSHSSFICDSHFCHFGVFFVSRQDKYFQLVKGLYFSNLTLLPWSQMGKFRFVQPHKFSTLPQTILNELWPREDAGISESFSSLHLGNTALTCIFGKLLF